MPCNCNTEFRFTYESLDLLTLNPRDFSLASAASTLGAIHALNKCSKDILAMRAEILQTSQDNAFLEHIVSQLRGVTPRGWARGENN